MPPLPVTPGDSNDYAVVVLDSDGLPYTLAGATITFTVRRSWDEPDPPVVVKSIGGGITVDGPGAASLLLDPVDTAGWPEDARYVWDLQVRTAGGRVYTVDRGTVIVVPAATRTT